MTDFAGAKVAIRERLEAGWTTTRITYQNKAPDAPWPPVDGDGLPAPFVSLEIAATSSDVYASGTPGNLLWLNDGFVRVHVFVPTGTGDELASEYAVAIGELFRAAAFYEDDDGSHIRTWAPRIDGGGSGDDDGNWFRVTMSVPFEYYHRG